VTDQKIARPSRSDVLRVTARDFPGDQKFQALRVLSGCSTGENEGVRDRVHAAVLKLACGNIERLRQLTQVAKVVSGLSGSEQQAIFDADWAEYHAWLSA